MGYIYVCAWQQQRQQQRRSSDKYDSKKLIAVCKSIPQDLSDSNLQEWAKEQLVWRIIVRKI